MANSKQSLVPVARYGLDDLMACLANEPEADEKAKNESQEVSSEAEVEAENGEAAAGEPSPALAAALDAVLRIAEETVLHRAGDPDRQSMPALSDRLSTLDLTPAQEQPAPTADAAAEPVTPSEAVDTPMPDTAEDEELEQQPGASDAPCMAFSVSEPTHSHLRAPAGQPIPSLAPMVRQMPTATFVEDEVVEQADDEANEPVRRIVQPSQVVQQPQSTHEIVADRIESLDESDQQPAIVQAARHSPTRRSLAIQTEKAKDIVDMLEDIGETLDSAETRIAQRLRPVIVEEPPKAPPGAVLHKRPSRGREAMVLSGFVLCLVAGIGGIVYSNSDWLLSVSAEALTSSEKSDEPTTVMRKADALGPIAGPPAELAAAAAGPTVTRASERPTEQSKPQDDAIETLTVEKTVAEIAENPPEVTETEPDAEQATRIAGSSEETDGLVSRAKSLMETGDIASARQLLEYAARRGNASAMMVLAQTYDPGFLLKMDIHGIRPDVDKAMAWYQRAAETQPDAAPSDAARQLNVSQRSDDS